MFANRKHLLCPIALVYGYGKSNQLREMDMGQTIGDGAIHKSTPQQHETHEHSGLHHEIHQIGHKHLLHHAHTAHHHKDTAQAHIPDLCIDTRSQGSLVADEDQNQAKMESRRAVAGVTCKPEAAPLNSQDSIVADEDQNQSKLIARMTIRGQNNESLVADEDQNQSKLLSRMAVNGAISNRDAISATPANQSNSSFAGFESLDLDLRPQSSPQPGAFSGFESLDLTVRPQTKGSGSNQRPDQYVHQ